MKYQHKHLALLAALLIAVVIVGWMLSHPGSETTEESATPVEGQPRATIIRFGEVAPDFSLIDIDGNNFTLHNHLGTIIVLSFMATWCGPCRQQMSAYTEVWNKYKDSIVFVSISVDPAFDSEEILRSFAGEFNATWIWARDVSFVSRRYGVYAIPTSVMIDQNGYVRFVHVGVADVETLTNEIESLLLKE